MAGPQLVRPGSGDSASAGQAFVWSRVDGASDYMLEVMNDSGRTLTRIGTKDTTATLPTSLSDSQRQQLSGWWVSATMPDGSQRYSELRLLWAASTR